jgi:hypothetical protein
MLSETDLKYDQRTFLGIPVMAPDEVDADLFPFQPDRPSFSVFHVELKEPSSITVGRCDIMSSYGGVIGAGVYFGLDCQIVRENRGVFHPTHDLFVRSGQIDPCQHNANQRENE